MSRRLLAILSLTIFPLLSARAASVDEKPMMKAVVAHEYGAPEVLKFEQVPRPEPKDDEALVHVIASGVNPADPLTLSGKYAQAWGTHLPLIPGSGGVGSFAVQIAKARGAKVIATASTANQDLLKQLGANVPIDYTKTKFEDVAKDVDAVLDPVGRETLAHSYDAAKKGGIVISLVARPDPVEIEKRQIRGATVWFQPKAKDLAEIAHLIDTRKIKPVVTQFLPLSEAIAAEQQAATHHTRGKVVLRVADEPKS